MMTRDGYRDVVIVFDVPGEAKGQGRPRATIRGGHASVYERAEDKSYKGLIQFYAMKAVEKLSERNGYRLSLPLEGDGQGFEVTILVHKTVPKSFSKKKREEALSGVLSKGTLSPRTKPDLDNIGKIVLDALNGVIWKDDSAVVSLLIRKLYSEKDFMNVCIECVEKVEKG